MTDAQVPEAQEQRKAELLAIWSSREGQARVLRLFHKALGPHRPPQAGMSVFNEILRHEFQDKM